MENPWRMLTPKEAAKQLGVSDQAVRRYFRSGILKGHTHGRYLLIDQRAVLALIAVIRQARGEKPTPPRRAEVKGVEGEGNDDQAFELVRSDDVATGEAI